MSSKFLKLKNKQKKNEKSSVLGAIKKYKEEEKLKPAEKKETLQKKQEDKGIGVVFGLHRFFY